ncbi:unnamed protein product [Discula destructiva]
MRPTGLPTRLSSQGTRGASICWQCSRRRQLGPSRPPLRPLPAPAAPSSSRLFSRTLFPRATAFTPSYPTIKAGYFSSNTLSDQYHAKPVPVTVTVTADAPKAAEPASSDTADADTTLPHRRRQATRRAAAAAAANADTSASAVSLPSSPRAATATTTTTTATTSPEETPVLPQNASDILTSVAASQPAHSMRRHLSALLSLSKPRLTVLVVLTAMAPYALYPVPAFLSPLAAASPPSLSPLTLLFLTTGTALCSAAANALNMLYEPATDAKMSRTRNRPLVRHLLTTRAAVLFALGCAGTGTAALYWGVNPTVAFLGAANIFLYAGVYTPLKRLSWLNTWVGALVGGIPPLMGWAAAAGESATRDGTFRELLFAGDGSSLGGWLMAALLFAWQFPHFMALSWGIRDEYRNAGLKMLSWVNPARNARVALRYSIVFVPICVGLCMVGVTEWTFAVTSLPANAWLIREAWKFWRHEGHKGSARGLFWASVWHLPAVMGLALLQKKGMWQRVWASIVGEPVDEEEWEDIDDDDDDEEEEEEDDEDVVDVAPLPVRVSVANQAMQGKNSS